MCKILKIHHYLGKNKVPTYSKKTIEYYLSFVTTQTQLSNSEINSYFCKNNFFLGLGRSALANLFQNVRQHWVLHFVVAQAANGHILHVDAMTCCGMSIM